MNTLYGERYVQPAVRMGDRRNVHTNQAIFTTNKIKLVEKGGLRLSQLIYARTAVNGRMSW